MLISNGLDYPTPQIGQILYGNGTPIPTLLTITAGTGITITNTGTELVFTATGSSGLLPFSVITTPTETMVTNNGYFANNATMVTFLLPTVSAVGDIIKVKGLPGSGGWEIVYGAGQFISVGLNTSTVGTGNIMSTNPLNGLTLYCYEANTAWINIDGEEGTIGVN